MFQKQSVIGIIILLVLAQLSYAGGILTNTNQSAQFVRILSRNASTEIDATYFNPAGLTSLSNGLHFAVYNQSIMQEKKINNNFPTLADNEYIGDVSAPLFPSVYAVYKKDKLALSFGFGPVAGGGGAKYETGLPSFEIPVSQLVPMLQSQLAPLDQAIAGLTGTNPGFSGVTGYNADVLFEGTSAYFGYQLAASYQITDMISLALGGRYNMAKNTYTGHLKGITVNAPAAYGGTMTPGNYLRTVAGAVQAADPNTAAVLNATATGVDAQTADIEVDSEQTGSGITPFFGLNLALNDKLNIGFKYELKTTIELENATVVDGSGMFPDGLTFRNDIPALLAVGADYDLMESLTVSASFITYFDKDVDWEGREELVDGNSIDIGVGLEYDINEKLLASVGFQYSKSGVSPEYQTDLSYSLDANTVGLGFRYRLNESLDIDLGALYASYGESEKMQTDAVFGQITETYNKVSQAIVVGLAWHLNQ